VCPCHRTRCHHSYGIIIAIAVGWRGCANRFAGSGPGIARPSGTASSLYPASSLPYMGMTTLGTVMRPCPMAVHSQGLNRQSGWHICTGQWQWQWHCYSYDDAWYSDKGTLSRTTRMMTQRITMHCKRHCDWAGASATNKATPAKRQCSCLPCQGRQGCQERRPCHKKGL
jgi:hypothetical protein